MFYVANQYFAWVFFKLVGGKEQSVDKNGGGFMVSRMKSNKDSELGDNFMDWWSRLHDINVM